MRHKLIEFITLLFILLFVYTAVSKLLDYEKFIIQIGQSPLLTNMAGFVAWFIPFIELAIVLLLVFPCSRLIGLYASFCLMLLFTLYVFMISQFSDFVPCSCGGVLQQMTWTQHLIFNLVFVISSLLAILFYSSKQVAHEDHP